MKVCTLFIGSLVLVIQPSASDGADVQPCASRVHYSEWTQKYFATARLVFLGAVADQELVYVQGPHSLQRSNQQNAGSMDALLKQIEADQSRSGMLPEFQLATFEINKIWKGELAGPKLVIAADLVRDDTGHHQVLSAGETYLVFAFADEGGMLRIPLRCVSSEQEGDTASKIRVLEALSRKPGDQ